MSTNNTGWLQEGSLLYRLTDDLRPCNRDEIKVTMSNGSRSVESSTARAGELLDLINSRDGSISLEQARKLFDAGWKAAAVFGDMEDVIYDGIVGQYGCPEFEEAFKKAYEGEEE